MLTIGGSNVKFKKKTGVEFYWFIRTDISLIDITNKGHM